MAQVKLIFCKTELLLFLRGGGSRLLRHRRLTHLRAISHLLPLYHLLRMHLRVLNSLQLTANLIKTRFSFIPPLLGGTELLGWRQNSLCLPRALSDVLGMVGGFLSTLASFIYHVSPKSELLNVLYLLEKVTDAGVALRYIHLGECFALEKGACVPRCLVERGLIVVH